MSEASTYLGIEGKITRPEMKKFVDALKKSIRQNQNRHTFFEYMERNLGEDAKKWKRIIEGNRMALAEIVNSHISKEGEVVFSGNDLKRMFTKAHSKGVDLDFLIAFVEFLKENRQDALELKKCL